MESILASDGGDPYVCRVPQPLERVTLTGRFVQLEPLSHDHVPELVTAATADRGTFAHTWVPDTADAMHAYVDTLLEQHASAEVLPFVQRRLDTGAAVGCTRFMETRWWRGRALPDEVEIGGTWLAASAQRSPVNTEAKLLLLTRAFDELGCVRVVWHTDIRNERSQAAIARLGAQREGVLRKHKLRDDGSWRDTVTFSMLDDEWPQARDRLAAALRR